MSEERKQVVEKDFYFAGVRFYTFSVTHYLGAPGYSCRPDFFISSFKDEITVPTERLTTEYCCKGNYRSNESCCLSVSCESHGSYDSFVVCPDWLRKNLPDLYNKIFESKEPEKLLKLSLFKAPEHQFPMNAYGLNHGIKTADEALASLTEKIGERFIRDLALARRISIDELLAAPKPEKVEIQILGRGDSIPWWVRKGYSEAPMSHEM